MNYSLLTREERYQIWILLKAGLSQKEIAEKLNRHPATISRELRRTRGQRGYRLKQADHLSRERAVASRCRPRITPAAWREVARLLRFDLSPEQIAARARLEGTLRVSPEWIYQFVYADKALGGDLHRHLRCQKQRRKRYGSGRQRRGQLVGRIGIAKRPAAAHDRREPGHWEGDTLIGRKHRGGCLTMVERTSRFTRIGKLRQRKAAAVRRQFRARLASLGRAIASITTDNGKEFARHQDIASDLGCGFYFADPYAAHQRGTNENTNGLIRQYLSKSRDLSTLTGAEIRMIENRLNRRPRKCLGYLTPFEVFHGVRLKLTVALRG